MSTAKYRKQHREELRLKAHEYKMKRDYGITIIEYNKLFIKQEGMCAICEKHQKDIKRRLCVDHCHKTGKVRGLLCGRCNTAAGLLDESTGIMKKMIEYLKK